MYDHAGEWIYRVGLPAKSGVGGGIIAAMPGQLGLGSFSPPLDEHGNSVRGLRVCEELSAFYGLHLLDPPQGASRCILADYAGEAAVSRRERRSEERHCLAPYRRGVRVLELYGNLSFADLDLVTRRLVESDAPLIALVLDLHRASGTTPAGAKLLDALLAQVTDAGSFVAVVGTPMGTTLPSGAVDFALLEDALEWVEDSLLDRHAEEIDPNQKVALTSQALLAGLSADEIAAVVKLGNMLDFPTGAKIIAAGGAAASLFFLLSGTVSVRLGGGRRVATLAAGSAFGKMALLRQPRSADVFADTAVTCLEVSVDRLLAPRLDQLTIELSLMRNLGLILADRLRQTNAKLQLLRA